MKESVKIEVQQNLRNSYNVNREKYNQGYISQNAYDILLHLSDKLNFRSRSYWQEKIHNKYGFVGLVDRINQIRIHWSLPIMDMDYAYYNEKKAGK